MFITCTSLYLINKIGTLYATFFIKKYKTYPKIPKNGPITQEIDIFRHFLKKNADISIFNLEIALLFYIVIITCTSFYLTNKIGTLYATFFLKKYENTPKIPKTGPIIQEIAIS